MTSRATGAKPVGTLGIHGRLQETYGHHSAAGRLQSGATIKAAIRLMEESSREAMTTLLADVGAVSREPLAFEQVDEAVLSILRQFGEDLVGVVKLAAGEGAGTSAMSAGLGLYRTMKSEIEADLIIALHGFVVGKASLPEPLRHPVKNKGGKPLAAHWDEMWASIAVQLWIGDLKPKVQADIKRAMLDWFSAREIDVSDTAVTDRARQLWLQIDAAR